MDAILNIHVIDPKNLGDCLSSPLEYFQFPGFQVEHLDVGDIRSFLQSPEEPGSIHDLVTAIADRGAKAHVILGGGGLLAKQFQDVIQGIFKQIVQPTGGTAIAWGVGQQAYKLGTTTQSIDQRRDEIRQTIEQFPYDNYVKGWDLVGVRDDGVAYDWVPCASCMHPAFDRDYAIEHDFVVYSHGKFELKLKGFPQLSHTETSMERVLAFLGSGETVLTSSFHGAYWATLLGRKVLAFPFTSKFMTLKHPIGIYPDPRWQIPRWRWRPFTETFLNKLVFELKFSKRYRCQTRHWQQYLDRTQIFPEALSECRQRNQEFYHRILEYLG